MNKKPPIPDDSNSSEKKPRGRPPKRHMPESIPDSPANVMRAILEGLPDKKDWRYLDEKDKDAEIDDK